MGASTASTAPTVKPKEASMNYTVLFVPVTPSDNLRHLNRQTISRKLESLAPNEIKDVRVNPRKNVLAIDVIHQASLLALTRVTDFDGIKLSRSMATTTMEQLGHVDDLRALQASLGDLTRNQGLLLDTVQQENSRFADALGSLDDVLQRARVYQAKLVRLKRDMTELQQRSSRLRKRALRLQQMKQKEALQAEQQRQRDLERTRQLQPRVAPQLAPP
ncbi:hypothetical protein HPB52_019685 [Rhipicephalus sanguineus]|uniref:Uncharacterized protein n=2 Tax=Rhipicephalus sanguineus TaxID=34632 RepID=A0A9D4SWN9_RHISA|nr:hypothetical protein HPB52_019685 [Rhipicephalus sanguineus]